MLDEVAERFERNLEVLGIVGVEEKIQTGVPQSSCEFPLGGLD